MKEIVAVPDLKLGMFIAELDRPWLESPFPIQGFLLTDEETLGQLRSLCRFVYVDRVRSTGECWRGEEPTPSTPPQPRVVVGVGSGIASESRRKPADFFALLRSLRAMRDAEQSGESAAGAAAWSHRYPGAAPAPRNAPAEAGDADDTVAGVGKDLLKEVEGRSRRGARVEHEGHTAAASGSILVQPEMVPLEEEILNAVPLVEKAHSLLMQIARDVQSSLNPDLERLRGVVSEMVLSVARNPDALLWLVRLKQTDQYSYDHSLDVAAHVMIFGRFLGLGEESITALGMAGMLQDVGKLRLPLRLLQKTGRLTPVEYSIFKTHVEYSLQVLAGAPHVTAQILEIVGSHHERRDGSGYPLGLAGDKVTLLAEIAGVADVFCAMTRERPYGEAASAHVALEALRVQRGVGFSESTIDQFVQCIGIYPVGTLVELSSGEVAVVVAQNRIRRLKPRIMILLGPDKKPNTYPKTIDLLYVPFSATGEPYAIVRALPPGAYGVEPSEFYLA